MNELLQRYVSVSISASLLLLILLLLQPLYKDRFAKQWQYYVWLIVILRFVIPWNPVNGLVGSLFYQIQERIQADELRMVFSSDHIYDNGIEIADGTEPADGMEPAGRTEPADGIEPAGRTEPTDGIEPADGTEPADGIEPAGRTEPADRTEPARIPRK